MVWRITMKGMSQSSEFDSHQNITDKYHEL
jgi:hypothetical protein